MSDLLVDLIPINLLEEKEKFFSDFAHNPQLKYKREFTSHELTRWGIPDVQLTEHSRQMLSQIPISPVTDPFVDQAYIEEQIALFNEKYNIPHKIIAHFSETQVTRCRIHENNIYFQLPIAYTKAKLADLFRHELETHLLRFINNQQQPWLGQKLDDINFRKTEEGLANLHTHLFRQDKIFRRSYLTYMAVSIAQQGSFLDVFNTMISYKVSKQTAWNLALRTKRGMTDTTQPGGLTKDISYLEGSVFVWKWLMNPKNNPHDLYVGRVGLVDLPRLLPQAKKESLIIPEFMDNKDEYLKHIFDIGNVNQFEKVELTYET